MKKSVPMRGGDSGAADEAPQNKWDEFVNRFESFIEGGSFPFTLEVGIGHRASGMGL